jgi:hypothetical protein
MISYSSKYKLDYAGKYKCSYNMNYTSRPSDLNRKFSNHFLTDHGLFAN